MDVDIAANRA